MFNNDSIFAFMSVKIQLPIILVILLLGFPRLVQSQSNNSWTDYRGPDKNGHSQAVGVPVRWSESDGIAWRSEVPGSGWSSPLILNGQVWLTTAEENGHQLSALCYDLETGKPVKKILVFRKDSVQAQHPLNSFASPTPAIEDGRIYVHFGAYGTAALDTRSGKILWKREDIHCEHEVGPGSSPIIWRDLLIFHMDGTDVQYVIALDKNTGKTHWKKERGLDFSELRFDEKKAFYTPIIHEIGGREQLISPGPHAVMGYDPASGEQLWIARYKGFSGSARPLIVDNKLFINTGFGMSSLVAFQLGGKGDITEKALLWENKKTMQARSSMLYVDGFLYLVNTGGLAKCLDPATGEEIWVKKVGGETSASPVYVNGLIYTFDQDGLCTLFKPGKTFQHIAENPIKDGMMASPAVIDSALVIRTKTQLIRIGH